MIRADQLTRHHRLPHRTVAALAGISFSVSGGERLAVVGRSGSGKSTLLNLLAGLDRPTSGTLTVHDRELSELTRDEMSAYRLHDVGVIFQNFQLIPQRTALGNVEVPLLLDGVSRSTRVQRATELLQRVGLGDRIRHLPSELSGGEQQRVAVARALVNRPKLLLADEPTGNLDTATGDEVVQLISELCEEQSVTLILVTHAHEVANGLCRRILTMSDGRILSDSADMPGGA